MLRDAAPADIPFIREIQDRPENRPLVGADDDTGLRAIIEDPTRALLIWEEDGPQGYALLTKLDSHSGNLELMRLAVAAPGRGTGARFLAAVLAHAFERLGAHRLFLDVAPDNPRAVAAYARAGFQQEGLLREAWLRRTGDRSDLIVMAILRREWQAAALDQAGVPKKQT